MLRDWNQFRTAAVATGADESLVDVAAGLYEESRQHLSAEKSIEKLKADLLRKIEQAILIVLVASVRHNSELGSLLESVEDVAREYSPGWYLDSNSGPMTELRRALNGQIERSNHAYVCTEPDS